VIVTVTSIVSVVTVTSIVSVLCCRDLKLQTGDWFYRHIQSRFSRNASLPENSTGWYQHTHSGLVNLTSCVMPVLEVLYDSQLIVTLVGMKLI